MTICVFVSLTILSCLHGGVRSFVSTKDPNLNMGLDWTTLSFELATNGDNKDKHAPLAHFQRPNVMGFEPLISGNELEAGLGMFPFVASLQVLWSDQRFYHICSAVLYKPNIVLTVAHCAVYFDSFDHYVALGVHSISQGGEAFLKVANHTIHPDFDIAGYGFPMDIMVLTLEEDVTLSLNIQLATLATFKDRFVNFEECQVMGWGRTNGSNAALPDTLQFATMKAISNNDCRKFYRVFDFFGLQQYHKCAWNWPNAPCRGDSGSPLVCDGKVIGLSSWGSDTCDGCFPFVFTNMAYHRGWLNTLEEAGNSTTNM